MPAPLLILPKSHAKCFDLSEPHTILPLNEINPSESLEQLELNVIGGVDKPARAYVYMSKAVAGSMPPRKPITVKQTDSGYEIIDGNATYHVAKLAGWDDIPVVIEKAVDGEAVVPHGSLHASPVIPAPPAIHAPAPATAAGGVGVIGAGPISSVYHASPLFHQHEVDAPKSRQHTADHATIFAQGHEANESLAETLDRGQGVSASHGMGVIDGNHEQIEGNPKMHEWGGPGHVILGKMKSAERAHEKVRDEYGGDWSQLTDAARATVVGDHHQHLHGLIAKTRAHMEGAGWKLEKAKDFYQKPTAMGYRGTLTNWRHPNGHVAEVQFMDRHMANAKADLHKHYEVTRSIHGAAMADGRDLTPSEKATVTEHENAQRRGYGAAWQHQVENPPRVHFHISKAMHFGGPAREAHCMETTDDTHDALDGMHYFDVEGAPAYSSGHFAPAYVLNGDTWDQVNKATVLSKGQTISKGKFLSMTGGRVPDL